MLATISNGFVVSRKTGASRAISSASSAPRRIGRAVGEHHARLLQHLDLGPDVLVAALGRPALAGQPLLDTCEVGEHELELERLEIALGIGLDTAVGERAQHDEDRVAVAQAAEELRAEALARLRPRRQREVHELEARGDGLLRLRHVGESQQTLVGQARNTHRGLVLAGHRRARSAH